MLKGTVCKGIGGFFYVLVDGEMYECKARGKIKQTQQSPIVGDHVCISVVDEALKLGIVEEIIPRANELLRPNVANVDQAVIVISVKDPLPNMMLLDKMLVLAEQAMLKVILCLNKSDLATDADYQAIEARFMHTDYRIIRTCAHSGEGVETLSNALKEHISVFSGPSGVGKSSLLNAIESGLALKIGGLSEKIKRGKHTTRHSELLFLKNGGLVLDTPGFTSLSIEDIEADALRECFPEFRYCEPCKFDNCLHLNEPGCRVKHDLRVHPSRYEAYTYMLNEIQNYRRNKKW